MACTPSKCCFFAPLRPGLLAWAYIRFIFAVSFMAWALYAPWSWGKYHVATYIYTVAFSIGPCALYMVFTVVLAIGLHCENYKLLLTFHVYSFFEVGASITLLVMQVVNDVTMSQHYPRMAQEYWRQPSSYINIIAIVVNILLAIYFIFVIRSELVKIKAQENQSKKALEEDTRVIDMPIAKEQDKRFDFVYSNPEEVVRKPLFPVEELQRLRDQLGAQKL